MEQVQTFRLIEGSFTPGEAREVLLALLNSKINFNHMAAFGLEERNDGDAGHHRKRVAELKAVRTQVSHLLEEARKGGFRVELQGEFSIQLVPDAKAGLAETTTAKVPGTNTGPEHYLA